MASAVENVSAAYSDTTVAPHEYFDQTRCAWGGAVRARLDLGGINLSRAEFFGLRGFFGAEIFLRGGAGFSSGAVLGEVTMEPRVGVGGYCRRHRMG